MPDGKNNILTLDIGNTSLRAGVFRQDRLVRVLTLKWKDTRPLSRLLQQHDFSACIVSAVAPVPANFLQQLRRNMRVLRMSPRILLPLKNSYRTPATLGHDRMACVAGANRLFPGQPVLVIDAGTCIKYGLSAHLHGSHDVRADDVVGAFELGRHPIVVIRKA